MGEAGRSFIPDIQQASSSSLMSAILAGIIFNISNILLVASINLAGMAVAFPVGVGLALALGVITTYIGNPQGDPLILFLGVVCVVIAIIFTAIAYGRVTQEALLPFWRVSSWDGFSASWRTPCLTISASLPAV